jgi:hypothetical protein
MNDQTDFLRRITEKLSAANIPFMLVGSIAASYHGHPRSTLDIDAVVDADEETLCRFTRGLGVGYYVSEESVRQAVRSRSVFNIIDEASGYKADLIVRKNRPFSQTEFKRRIRVKLLDQVFDIAAPEDVILSKLEWSKLGESERQWNDALQVARTQKEHLDLAYLEKWAGELGVADLWNRMRELVYPEKR